MGKEKGGLGLWLGIWMPYTTTIVNVKNPPELLPYLIMVRWLHCICSFAWHLYNLSALGQLQDGYTSSVSLVWCTEVCLSCRYISWMRYQVIQTGGTGGIQSQQARSWSGQISGAPSPQAFQMGILFPSLCLGIIKISITSVLSLKVCKHMHWPATMQSPKICTHACRLHPLVT